MSEVQNNLGEKFKETIAEAMKTGDFHALNTLVTDTVNDALREADFQANLSREATEKKVWNSQRSWQDKRREEVKTEAEIQAERQQREKQQEERRRQNEEWHRQRREREKQWEEQRKAQAEQNRARNQAQPVTPSKATAAEMTSLVKNGKEGKCVRNIVYCVRRDRTGVQRTGTSGTAVTGSFSGSISECGDPSGGIVSGIFRDDLLWQRTA